MDTALIIVLAIVALVIIAFLAKRAGARATEKRREMAGDLRVEATEAETRARRAEVQAEKEREVAQSRAARADRVDPDTGGSGRSLNPLSRRDDDEAEARS